MQVFQLEDVVEARAIELAFTAPLRQRALNATLEGCDRATRLVDQLLTLSRLEAGAAALGQSVDLGAVIRSVVADLAPQAIDKQQSIEVDAPQSYQVQGDALLLAVLVRNLVDNAIRYCPIKGHIQVAVRRKPDHIRLLVDDSGPGMSEADMQRVGERFFRVLGTAQSGSGLGWSIVLRIAAVHQARAAIGRANGLGGLSATVDWPVR